MFISSMSGIEGQVSLAGIRSVVGMFVRWSLTRRGEHGSSESWVLRAVLSYQKTEHLTHPKFKKLIQVKLPAPAGQEPVWYDVVPNPGVEIRLEHDTHLVIEGATICRAQKPPR